MKMDICRSTRWSSGISYMDELFYSRYQLDGGLTVPLGRAIAQAVSRWLPTAAARVRSWVG
jgi:hypothetical protein